MWDLVRNPKDRFSGNVAQLIKVILSHVCYDDVYFRNNANIYNENGTLVEKLIDVKGTEQPPNPCVIGPNLYMITKDRLR